MGTVKNYALLLCVLLLMNPVFGQEQGEASVLVFTKTEGFTHETIPDGVEAIKKVGEELGISVDVSSDSEDFNDSNLNHYKAVVFVSTTGNLFNQKQRESLKKFIRDGGGYLGIHAASDCCYNWPWYEKLVGAYFKMHPKQLQYGYVIHHLDKNFPYTLKVTNPWIVKDEWYNFRSMPQNVNILASIDENSYIGGDMGSVHPLVWYHEFEGGRSFYIGMGHMKELYQAPDFLMMMRAGLKYAVGMPETETFDSIIQKAKKRK